MLTLAHLIERMTFKLGQALSWLVFVMMFCMCAFIFLRSGLNQGFTALQESINYLHATLFMLGIAFTLQQDEHVRVDVFYQKFSARTKNWINALGCIFFLMPLCVFILFNSLDFVSSSWAVRETSIDPGGLPFVYVLKSLIPLMALSLFLQAFALVIKNTSALMHVNEGSDS